MESVYKINKIDEAKTLEQINENIIEVVSYLWSIAISHNDCLIHKYHMLSFIVVCEYMVWETPNTTRLFSSISKYELVNYSRITTM